MAKTEGLEMLKNKFSDTIDKVFSIFGSNSFKRIEVNGEFYRWINKAIYDFIMLSFERYDKELLLTKKTQIIDALRVCINEDSEFENSITVGTSEPRRMEYRLRIWLHKMDLIMNDCI